MRTPPRTRLPPNGAGNVGRRGRAAGHANGPQGGGHVKSRLAVGLLLGCLVAAAGCSSSSSSAASPATTAASPATTTASPTPKITAKNFQVSTPNGQVSLSLDGQLPPTWPSQFPVPAGAKPAGSGSLGGSSSATLVAAYTTSQPALDAFAFYTDNPKLTTSGQRSAGAGGALRREGEDHRTLHGLGHGGLPQRHHLHRHRADERSSFFSYRQLAHDLRHADSMLTAKTGVSLTCTRGTDGPLPVPSGRWFSRSLVDWRALLL